MSDTDGFKFKGERLLIVDDNPQQLTMAAAQFRAKGFEVKTLLGVRNPQAGNGYTGFDGVFHNAEEFRALVAGMDIDAMLTDCQIISRRDVSPSYYFWGEEATRLVRELKPNLPVVMHTTDERNPLAGKVVKEQEVQRFARDVANYKETGGLDLFYKGDIEPICATFKHAFEQGKPATPVNITTERARPKLVIFDDDSVLLQRFTKEYAERGYDVTPVLVGVRTNDSLFVDGSIKHHRSDYDPVRANDPNDWEYQDRIQLPERTVQSELEEAKRDNNKVGISIYSAMSEFNRGVVSKTQVRALLHEIKPDFVLSDMSMREPQDGDMTPQQRAEDDDTILGTDIMALTKEVLPGTPRAIHSGGWTQEDGLKDHIREARKASHEKAKIVAAAEGYAAFAKDTWLTTTTPPKVQAYFEASAEKRCARPGP